MGFLVLMVNLVEVLDFSLEEVVVVTHNQVLVQAEQEVKVALVQGVQQLQVTMEQQIQVVALEVEDKLHTVHQVEKE
tara:strand:+ start:413 stop:643 length:231 start_codon:yes stop_codon:yes gene_type:complete